MFLSNLHSSSKIQSKERSNYSLILTEYLTKQNISIIKIFNTQLFLEIAISVNITELMHFLKYN